MLGDKYIFSFILAKAGEVKLVLIKDKKINSLDVSD
jgi:hypothetical protein